MHNGSFNILFNDFINLYAFTWSKSKSVSVNLSIEQDFSFFENAQLAPSDQVINGIAVFLLNIKYTAVVK